MSTSFDISAAPGAGDVRTTSSSIVRGGNAGNVSEQSQAASTWRIVYEPAKTLLDFALAIVLLVVCAPVILAAAVAVRLSSTGPAFYTQTRVGKCGQLFRIYKIRTMYHNVEDKTGIRWSTPGDSRITPLGRFLRRTHIDELPQLLNVLRIEMSLVGPRPERPEIIPTLEAEIPNYRERLRVRPGVTGLAQLRLPADIDIPGVRRKLNFDLYYIRGMGPWLDLRLVACTVLKMIGIPLCGVLWLCRIPGQSAVGVDVPSVSRG